MSPNRKADLQRKLAMAPIPKPPAGLAERIKSDIPQHLLVDARKERERLSRSIAFNLRVAASIILLVGSVYLAMRVLSMKEFERTKMEVPTNVVVAQKQAPAPAAARTRDFEAAPQPVEVKTTTVPTTTVVQKQDSALARTAPKPTIEAKREELSHLGYLGGAAPSRPAPAPAPPPQAPATAADNAASAYAAPRAMAKVTDGFVPEAKAAAITLAPSTLFEIDAVHTDLVQRFAAPAASPHALRVDAEATTLDETTLVRVSVDAPEVEHPAGGSEPPIAADAKLDIAFDDDNVLSHRALAGTTSSTASALPAASSVSALFTVELKPGLSSNATIATVTLRYNSTTNGKSREIARKIRRADLRAWDDASKRMKATSLAAALANGLSSKETIAEKARAAGLSELAELAEKP